MLQYNDGEWQKIAEGGHIPATKGDVTLRGNFHMLDPEGGYVGIYRGDLPIAFYTDHINLTFYETGAEPFVIDMENPVYGDSVCGVGWTAFFFFGENEEQIEILVHNPHSFGNETAIDEMLSSIALWWLTISVAPSRKGEKKPWRTERKSTSRFSMENRYP